MKIQLRRATAAQWTAANPTLAAGEVGVETDTSKAKIGDGVTAWNSLGYGMDPDAAANAAASEAAAEAAQTAAEAAETAAVAAMEAAVDISNIDTSDGVVSTLVNNPLVGPLTTEALQTAYSPQGLTEGTWDGIVAGMRPKTFARTYWVDGSLAASEVSQRRYKTYAEAYTQSVADLENYYSGQTGDRTRSSPDIWHRVIVSPGTYNETVQLHDRLAVVSSTGNYEDVVFWYGGNTVVVYTGGSSTWLYGITFEYRGSDRSAHAHRDSTGDPSYQPFGGQRRQVLIDNCKLWQSDVNNNAEACATDSTPGPGVLIVFNRVWFKADACPQPINMVAGTPPSQQFTSEPETIMFINCFVDGNHLPATGEVGQAWGAAYPVGLVSGATERADTFVWVGNNFDIGDPFYPDGHSNPNVPPGGGTLGVGTYIATGNPIDALNCKWYIDPSIPDLSLDGTADQIHREVYLPTLGKDGSSLSAWQFHGEGRPVYPDTRSIKSPIVSTGRRALVSGRTYWVRMPINTQLAPGRITLGATFAATTPGKKFSSGFAPDDGSGLPTNTSGVPWTDGNYTSAHGPLAILPVGDRLAVGGRFSNKRMLWPGMKWVWVGIVCDDSAMLVDSVVSPVTGLEVLYKDGWNGTDWITTTGLSALPDGATIPLPVLQQWDSDVVVFDNDQVVIDWAWPTEARALRFELQGGGAGGSSGRRGAAGTGCSGGAGGGGGGFTSVEIPTHRLPATLRFEVGTGAAGAAAQTSDNTDGLYGGNGGTSKVCDTSWNVIAAAGGGTSGWAGQIGTTAQAGGAGTGLFGAAGAGAASPGDGTAPSDAPLPYAGAPGGGAGGGITSGDSPAAGSKGGYNSVLGAATRADGGAAGAAGANGYQSLSGYSPGGGGGGGGGSQTAAAGAGGEGGWFGAGGGGGGSSRNGFNSGAGGKGRSGYIVVTIIR